MPTEVCLTPHQLDVLRIVSRWPGSSTRELVEAARDALGWKEWYRDQAHGTLARLERKELVYRSSRPGRWRLTPEGKQALRG